LRQSWWWSATLEIPALALTAVVDVVGLRAFPHTSVFEGAHGYVYLPANLRSQLTVPTGIANLAFLQAIHAKTFGNDGPLWSLAYEFWFYALLPCVLVACVASRRWARRFMLGLLAIAIAVFIGSVVLEYFGIWLLGAIIAWARPWFAHYLTRRGRVEAIVRLALIGVVAALMALDKTRPGFRSDAILGIGSALLVGVLTVDGGWGFADRLVGRFSTYAHSSYSLYAIHFPLVALIAAILVPQINARWAPTGGHLLEFLVVIAGVLVLGWAFARLTERNTGRVRDRVFALVASRPDRPDTNEPALAEPQTTRR
jgi:peptidoglycan/LPS O-acetylase OafA/YrhL